MSEPVIWENDIVEIRLPTRPHITREDGGHLVVYPKRSVSFRSELNRHEVEGFALVLQSLELAYIEGMNARGIHVIWVNIQDNGNWSLLRKTPRHFHVHIYGRCLSEKRQRPGQALFFPDPSDKSYETNERLNKEDISEIICRLEINMAKQEELDEDVPFTNGRLNPLYA